MIRLHRSYGKYQKNRGFALILAIFFSVALQGGLTSGMYNMMRLQRQAQHTADEMRLNWVAEAVLERAIKLLSDHVSAEGAFPNRDHLGRVQFAIENAPFGSLNASLTESQSYEAYLTSWFDSLASIYPQTLSDISVSAEHITITDQSTSEMIVGDRSRHYVIEVTTQKMVDGIPTTFQTTVRQEFVISRSKLFDFSVFCSDDCEITAGPSFTLQGPIFSNKHIYLMIDQNNRLTLTRADSVSGVIDPEPYVIRTAKGGHIYFYFKRMLGANYFLGNDVYKNSVSRDYLSLNGLEIYPGFSSQLQLSEPLPYFYYFKNGAECDISTVNSSTSGFGDNCKTNRIFVENWSGGYDQLFGNALNGRPNPRPRMYPQNMLNAAYYAGADRHDTTNKFYTVSYGGQKTLSVSSAYDQSNIDTPLVNPISLDLSVYQGAQPLVAEGDDPKDIPIKFRWIDPLTVGDSAELRGNKLHSKADVEFLIGCQRGGDVQAKFVPHDPRFFDRPDNNLLKPVQASDARGASIKYEIDIGNLTGRFPDAQVVYFHVCGDDSGLRLVNGAKLPQDGFTFVSSGKIWIKSDYNTFDYSKQRHCTEGEWDGGECVVPSAAIFSDSFGVLSKQWNDAWVPLNNGQTDPNREVRKVTENVMINTALATGNVPSRLRCNPAFATVSGIDGNGSEICLPKTDFENLPVVRRYAPGPDNMGRLLGPEYGDNDHAYQCPKRNGAFAYTQGRNISDSGCEYYREGFNVYHYYVNPKSRTYRQAVRKALAMVNGDRSAVQIPLCRGYLEADANLDGMVDDKDDEIWDAQQNQTGQALDADFNGDGVVNRRDRSVWQRGRGPVDCADVRIPIFADPRYGLIKPNLLYVDNVNQLKAAPPFPGVHFTTLNRIDLTGRTTYSTMRVYYCGNEMFANPPSYECVGIPAEGTTNPRNCCLNGQSPRVENRPDYSKPATVYPPGLKYYFRDYEPLYVPTYSGGIENLINLQEDWSGKTLRFLGTLSIPWEAQKLTKDYGVYYYRAPFRKFDYNERLRFATPPGTPRLLSIQRRSWSRN